MQKYMCTYIEVPSYVEVRLVLKHADTSLDNAVSCYLWNILCKKFPRFTIRIKVTRHLAAYEQSSRFLKDVLSVVKTCRQCADLQSQMPFFNPQQRGVDDSN